MIILNTDNLAWRIGRLEAEVARCHARLEIDHHFVAQDGELVRVEIPMAERADEVDGIECRDATIRELEAQLASARREERQAAAAEMRERAAQIVEAQPYYPDTNIGMRQQWVKDQAAAAIRRLPLASEPDGAKP